MEVTVMPFDVSLHAKNTVSAEGVSCGQGGVDTCPHDPVFSVLGAGHTISTCDVHLHGAVRQALKMRAAPTLTWPPTGKPRP